MPGENMRAEMAKTRMVVAQRAMQSGIATHPGTYQDPAKNLRVGVDSALVELQSVCALLIKKGVISEVEYRETIAEAYEAEVKRYEDELTKIYGHPVRCMPCGPAEEED